ncbi:PEP-CTERM sorting domain-containing protein [Cerasicoccus fimbriatus]|uniref:PEP-CTERM sorting domain-containing protein n=1 Tax=Cerasicoccus fimbriatus TaxID=3014554 RepID=UPI0022B56E52|nr:PEP-CTERM sorting domain-containing protein [Cerasicoccus sp. TK19100]
MRLTLIRPVCLVFLSLPLLPCICEAVFAINDTLAIDFSKLDTTTGPAEDPSGAWNNITGPSLGFGVNADPIPTATNLVRYADGASTGVSLSLLLPATSQVGISSSTILVDPSASFTATGAIPSSAQSDAVVGAKILDAHSETTVTFRFNNLNDGLLYNLEFQSWSNAYDYNVKDYIIQLGLLSEQTISVDPNSLPSVYGFNNIATNGSGQITLTIQGLEKGADTAVINAMALTAIPEPATYALVLSTLSLLGILIRSNNKRM